MTNIVPNVIKKGTVSGIPLENLSATYSITLDSETPVETELRFEIDFGQDLDGDGWKDETERAVADNAAPPYSLHTDIMHCHNAASDQGSRRSSLET